jgi:hypothetical protein
MRKVARLLCGVACLVTPASAYAGPYLIDSMRPSGAPVSGSVSITDGDASTDPDASADASARPGRIPYNGGPIISQARVAAVFWGNGVDRTVVSNIPDFYASLMTGSFMHFVSEYSTPTQGVGSYGTFLGAFRIRPVHTSSTVTDADIQAELAQQIAFGALPSADDNTIYMIHFPPGVTVQGPGTTGLSCVDYCGYHYYGNGLTYAVLPDQSGGCAPGPFGCESSTTARCCGDRTAFENLTKSASHELMESITDPQPLAPAWTDILGGFGEIGDVCNFSKQGDNAFASVIGQSGATYQGQKGFSNSAFLAGIGSPRGCVTYPTVMCCDTAAPTDLATLPPTSTCSWLPNGLASCARGPSDLTISLSTIGGFGSGTIGFLGSSPYSGVCIPFGTDPTPQYCATVQAPGLVEQPNATMVVPVDSTHPTAEACYGPAPAGGCRSGTSNTPAGCCGPLLPFVVSGSTQTVTTPLPGVATVPALPPRKAALYGLLLAALGCLRVRKARAAAPDTGHARDPA